MPEGIGYGGGIGDSVLQFLKGLTGGGGNGEAPPIAEEPGSDPRVPWEDPSLRGEAPAVADRGTAAPVAEEPTAPTQTDADSLIDALRKRNQEFAPYRDTGLGIE